MSAKIQQNAENIKSQRKYRAVMNQNEFANDDQKDEEIVIEALKRMRKRGRNIRTFMWQTMYELCYQNEEENKQEIVDEKTKEDYQTHISQLTDTRHTQMCKYGHGRFKRYKGNDRCIRCSSMEGRRYCNDCYEHKENSGFAAFFGRDSKDYSKYIYCKNCRLSNAETIKQRIKTNKMKALIIRNELIRTPILEMDLLCNMQRRAALDSLINDINTLPPTDRSKWILLMFDLDYLKAWNTCIGHVSTDKLIEKIGNIINKYTQQINDRKDETQTFEQSFAFRTGGDEFVMVFKCKGMLGAQVCKFGKFYRLFKSEINELGQNIKEFVNENEWSDAEAQLNKAMDRNGNKINMKIVGLSCGVFVPAQTKNTIKDWLSIADKIALETAKKSNGINKNGYAIYWEKRQALISKEKAIKQHGMN
eukprot:171489_1